MKYLKKKLCYFSFAELCLWLGSVAFILISFIILDRQNYLSLLASLTGVSSLIFNAKGNPFGQILMIIFSIEYGIISFGFAYYGEMITYLGMTLPMAVLSFFSWLKNPSVAGKSEVKINQISNVEQIIMWLITAAVTSVFYFILEHFNTANLVPSTISVATSFIAAYLTLRRSPYYAIGYAANDVVLIVLWILASIDNMSYVSVVICFAVFLINDIYGFINWQKMKSKQKAAQP